LLCFELKAAIGANVVVASDILAALRAGKDKLCATVGAHIVVGAKGVAAIRAQIHTAVGANFVVLANRLAAVAAKCGPLDNRLFFCLFCLFLFVYNAFVQLGAAVWAHRGVGGDLLVTYGAIKSELGPAIGANGGIRIHPGSALGTKGVLVQFSVINQLFCHGFTLDRALDFHARDV
jgi:hypothetical protein